MVTSYNIETQMQLQVGMAVQKIYSNKGASLETLYLKYKMRDFLDWSDGQQKMDSNKYFYPTAWVYQRKQLDYIKVITR